MDNLKERICLIYCWSYFFSTAINFGIFYYCLVKYLLNSKWPLQSYVLNAVIFSPADLTDAPTRHSALRIKSCVLPWLTFDI